MIEAVYFDAAGTLIHLPQGVGYHYCLVLARHGVAVEEPTLARAFRAAWKEMPARENTTGPRVDDDKGWWKTLVGKVVAPFVSGRKGFDFEACFAELYDHFTLPGVWALYPETREVLLELSGKCRLAVVSNFDRRLRVILEQLGIAGFFESITISSEVGADKPDPRIFQTALAALRMSPEKTLLAGDDRINDWEGGAAVGMQIYRLERPENTLTGLLDLLGR